MPRQLRKQKGHPQIGSLFPNIEPKIEEDKKQNIGFWKQIILYRNRNLIEKYPEYKKEKKIWMILKNVWVGFSATYEPFEYNKKIEKNRWRFLFELLGYEKKNDYERLKKSWENLGDFRKTIIFACSAGKETHEDFLAWVIWKRLDGVKRMENDSMPWMLNNAVQALLKIMLSKEYYQESIKESVRWEIKKRAKDIEETGMYKSPYLRNAIERAIHAEFCGFLRELCFTSQDIEKVMKRVGRVYGELLDKKIIPKWIKNNKELIDGSINTALQHTQNV